jgi:hypothetical protein
MGFPITQRPITGNITVSGQTFVVPCLQANFVLVQMVATSLSGHVCSIEGSIDSTTGADGNWFSISASRSNAPGTIEQATGTLAATPAYFWRINCAGMKYIRFRSTGHTAGTAAYTAFTLEDEIDAVIGGIVALAGPLPAIVGQGAEDAAVASNAVRVGGRVRTAHPTTFVAGDAADASMTTAGQLIVKLGGATEVAFSASLALTTTTAAAVAAAAAAGLKRHLTNIQAINTGAAAVDLILLDGATEIWRLPLPVNVPVIVEWDGTHLPVTAATALNANLSAAGTVRLNAQGYTAP